VQRRLRQPAPPALVGKAHRPVGTGLGQGDQAVAALLFWVYAGSGLVIQALARRQRMPCRASVARTVSSLTREAVMPSRYAVSAASSSVQTLLRWPNSRGERGSSARNLTLTRANVN